MRDSRAPRWDGRSTIHNRLTWWDKTSQLFGSFRSGRTRYAVEGSTIGGLITIAVSDLEGKVLMIGGAWLGVKFFGMPYRGFSNASC
jgi:hypothetical protein